MSIPDYLEANYPEHKSVSTKDDIPKNQYMVYVLACNDKAIVVGKGKHNRVQVITDRLEQLTISHIKSFFVRLYHLYETDAKFDRFIILCSSSAEAGDIEKQIYKRIEGDTRALPSHIEESLFHGVEKTSLEYMLLKQAQLSSFSGIKDLRGWNKHNLVPKVTWNRICEKLAIPADL